MRMWGFVITVVYALVTVLLYGVGIIFLVNGDYSADADEYFIIASSSTIALLLLCQISLLAVTVDGGQKWLRSRRPIWISVVNVSLALGLLTCGALFAIWAAIAGDDAPGFLDRWFGVENSPLTVSTIILLCVVVSWTFWALIFRYDSGDSEYRVARLFRWLYAGSVLELLVVVPCHIFVRSREDCCAPILTGYGIATGLAVMLLGFGPGVMYLYKKKLNRYQERNSAS